MTELIGGVLRTPRNGKHRPADRIAEEISLKAVFSFGVIRSAHYEVHVPFNTLSVIFPRKRGAMKVISRTQIAPRITIAS